MSENGSTPDNGEQARAQMQFHYALKLYDDSLARYRALDAKAARSVPTYALILAIGGFLPTQLDLHTLPPHFFWVIGLLFTVGLLCAVVGMAYLVWAMATRPTKGLPNDERTILAFRSADASQLSRDVAERAHEAALDIDREGDEKAKAVKCGLQLWIPTMSLILLSVLLMVFLSDLCAPLAAQSSTQLSTERSTVTENCQPSGDPNDQEGAGNQPEPTDDPKSTDTNLLGPNRILAETHEQSPPPSDDGGDDP